MDVAAQKLSPHRSDRRKIEFFAWTSSTRRRGRPSGHGSQKNFVQENFGLTFRSLNPRKTKGQQLKGKIVRALLRTFSHFSTLFHTFPHFFTLFPPGLSLTIKAFS